MLTLAGLNQDLHQIPVPSWLTGLTMFEAAAVLFCAPLSWILLGTRTGAQLSITSLDEAVLLMGESPAGTQATRYQRLHDVTPS